MGSLQNAQAPPVIEGREALARMGGVSIFEG